MPPKLLYLPGILYFPTLRRGSQQRAFFSPNEMYALRSETGPNAALTSTATGRDLESKHLSLIRPQTHGGGHFEKTPQTFHPRAERSVVVVTQ